MSDTSQTHEMSEEELQKLVADADTGGRNPSNDTIRLGVAFVAIAWSVFQLWVAQGQQIILPVFNAISPIDFQALGGDKYRIIHLAFALALAFLSYPALKSSPRDRVPMGDWILTLAGVFVALYYFMIFGEANDPKQTAAVTPFQLVVAVAGMVVLAEAVRRSLGPIMVILAIILLALAYFGNAEILAVVGLQTGGKDADDIVRDAWYLNGVFGIPLGVSAQTVFMFVLFGAMLEKAGAGNYFIKLAFGALGHLRGGPAKAAVIGSAATGLISGSSIANVVTTGTFTIPLMRRVGFSREKAGAVEVASSVNGQIMPPVMGAAAFLMVEYIGIPYTEVVKHAFVPAAISYIALVYLVHLEALKSRMPALPKPGGGEVRLLFTISNFLMGFVIFGALAYVLQFPIGFIKDTFGASGNLIVVAIAGSIILWLITLAAKIPDLEADDPNAETIELPVVKDIYLTGLYFVIPIFVLIYLLMIEQQSAGKSAFFSVIWLMGIMLVQQPVKAILRRDGRSVGRAVMDGIWDVVAGLEAGARNMIGVAIATAAAGVIVAAVQMAQLDQKMSELVGILAGPGFMLFIVLGILCSIAANILPPTKNALLNNLIGFILAVVATVALANYVPASIGLFVGTELMATLILCALFSLVLGMGLPTTANYIIVSTIMVNVIVSLAAQEGLVVPLIAAHLFVFYFGIMADVTPPVGLASFAAAAVSGGDPIKTGFTAFFYSLRTVALPFLFIFNTALILDFPIDGLVFGLMVGDTVDFWLTSLMVFVQATIAMLVFAAALQGFFFARSYWWESVLLLIIAFMIFRPGVLQNAVQPEFASYAPAQIEEAFAAHEPGREVQLDLQGLETKNFEEIITLSAGLRVDGDDPRGALAEAGYVLEPKSEGTLSVKQPSFGTEAATKVGAALDFFGGVTVEEVRIQQAQLPQSLFLIPPFLVLAFIIFLQRPRQRKEEEEIKKGAMA